mmetsp:Transcript_5346/g.5867  ORF Transcript_5346/g.5867 Transcript_5346/m.5867 type:complete len:80 (-) Transcript_5346:587-826(-)
MSTPTRNNAATTNNDHCDNDDKDVGDDIPVFEVGAVVGTEEEQVFSDSNVNINGDVVHEAFIIHSDSRIAEISISPTAK